MTSDEMLAWSNAMPYDCNGNGIPDSTDIRRGYDVDSNRNGEIDYCDPDTSIRRLARTGSGWHAATDFADSSYFALRHELTRSISIRYTIPGQHSPVRLTVLDFTGAEIDTLVDTEQRKGAYELQWDRTLRGRPAPLGDYAFRLQVGGREYSRPMAFWK